MKWGKFMSALVPGSHVSASSQSAPPSPSSEARRLIVTASVVIFAIRDWSLWVLLRDGPWGPPMRLIQSTETVMDAVGRTIDALLLWPTTAPFLQLKAGWEEQQVCVWGSMEQGTAVSLIHSVLLRANCDELRPNLHSHPIPSLRVGWTSVLSIESGQHELDPEVRPVLQIALHTLRSYIQRDPEIVLRYLADIGTDPGAEWWKQNGKAPKSKDTPEPGIIQEPIAGDGLLTLAEAALLYRAFFPADEQIDLSNLRRRFIATNKLEPLEEERPVRGRELDWRRVSRLYKYRSS